jgi:hypothetical protein
MSTAELFHIDQLAVEHFPIDSTSFPFALAMTSALLIYLRPLDHSFSFNQIVKFKARPKHINGNG